MSVQEPTRSSVLRLLLLEDNSRDAEMNPRKLIEAGFHLEPVRVETEAAFLNALDPPPDLILSDYKLPQFDGLRALEIVRGRGPDVPFILVSATLDEEAAVGAIKLGADD